MAQKLFKQLWDVVFYLYMGWAIPNSVNTHSYWSTAILSFALGGVVMLQVAKIILEDSMYER